MRSMVKEGKKTNQNLPITIQLILVVVVKFLKSTVKHQFHKNKLFCKKETLPERLSQNVVSKLIQEASYDLQVDEIKTVNMP